MNNISNVLYKSLGLDINTIKDEEWVTTSVSDQDIEKFLKFSLEEISKDKFLDRNLVITVMFNVKRVPYKPFIVFHFKLNPKEIKRFGNDEYRRKLLLKFSEKITRLRIKFSVVGDFNE